MVFGLADLLKATPSQSVLRQIGRRRAYLGCDEHFDEPPEIVFYCPECAGREFGRH
jgi:hypothetical protein